MSLWKKTSLLCLLVFSLSLPFIFESAFIQHILVITAVNIVLVLGLDMVLGHTGLLSLGHAGFMGVGAYTCAIMVMKFHVPFIVGLFCGTVMAGLAGALIGYPSLRLRGHYFVIVTFICGIIFTLIFTNMVSVTNGPMGIPRIPAAEIGVPGLFRLSFTSKVSYYYLVLFFIFLITYVKYRFFNSRMGRALVAVREDEDLARSVSIHTNFYKVMVFSISTGIAGLAGGLYAHYIRFIGPDSFTMTHSFNFFVMNMIGGSGTIVGPVIGPFLLTLIDEMSQLFKPEVARILFGVVLIIIIIYMPKGIMGLLKIVLVRRKT
jgi:branched-chain amino acid transport system permease protein